MPKHKRLLKQVAPKRPLTRKQQAFVKHLLDNPKASATQAALVAYGKPDKELDINTAKSIASENLTKPNIMALLADASVEAEGTVIGIMRHGERDEVRLNAAKDVLDRVHGKAVANVQVTQSVVTVNMDLTSSLLSKTQ